MRRYEFFQVSVAKRTDRPAPGLAGALFGVRTTVFHVLLVSNADAAWRRFAVCARTFADFVWLSNYLKNECVRLAADSNQSVTIMEPPRGSPIKLAPSRRLQLRPS